MACLLTLSRWHKQSKKASIDLSAGEAKYPWSLSLVVSNLLPNNGDSSYYLSSAYYAKYWTQFHTRSFI